MHFSFIPYGKRELVERLLREMEAQKFPLIMTKGKKTKSIYIDGQVRQLPFGVYEYVFPKEYLDVVLSTLSGDTGEYGVNFKMIPQTLLRKFLKLKKIPKFEETTEKIFWRRDYVAIFSLGIREDEEVLGTCELDKGWTHEAI